jgi:hypothetical protein
MLRSRTVERVATIRVVAERGRVTGVAPGSRVVRIDLMGRLVSRTGESANQRTDIRMSLGGTWMHRSSARDYRLTTWLRPLRLAS